MPNIMIHEEVAYFLKDKINLSSYDFYLGVLVPDSPNLYGFAEKEVRWTAHIRRKDLNDWRIALKDFYNASLSNYPKDFLIGYVVHVLTDIIYDDLLYLNVRDKIMNDNISKEESHNVMRDDMDKYYFNEVENIKRILNSNNTSYEINGISKELMLAWKNKFINTNINTNTSKYQTSDIIIILNNQVLKELPLIIN
jgi:hypothetical protein